MDALSGFGGPLTVSDCVFEENTATVGGAIAASELVVEDSLFRANTAFQGGAIAHRGVEPEVAGPLVITRSVLSGNTAESGGALDLSGSYGPRPDGELVLEGTVLIGNDADVGGGMSLYATNVTLDAASRIEGNTSLLDGAGANFHGETWTGGTVVGNVSMRSGGGIAADHGTVSGVRLEGNSALVDGGGLYASDAVSLRDCVFLDNSAGADGGGIRALLSELEILRVELRGNVADRGGGIAHNRWDGFEAPLDITDSVIAENTAVRWGGGLYAELRGGAFRALGTDFGDPAADNVPDDVAIAADFDGAPIAYGDFGADASFTCRATPVLECEE